MPARCLRVSRFSRIGFHAFVLATAGALTVALPTAAHAQDLSCDREGAREVRALTFEGNKTFSSDELSTRVVTTSSSLWRRIFGVFHIGTARCLPEEGLAPDVANLKAFYKYNGFYETQVDTVVKAYGPDRVSVTFRINEGAPLLADTVLVTGLDSVPDRQAILRDLQARPGERVGLLQVASDQDSIAARLRNQGYPRAAVFRAFTTNLSRQRAEVGFDVATGPRARIGTIDIERTSAQREQAPGIDSSVVLGLLGFRSGNWYSDRALNEASRNLYNLGAYRHVGITVDTTRETVDSLVGVNVDVREDFLRTVHLEEGWGTLDCFKVESQYSDLNFADKAWRLDVTGRASKIGYGRPTDSRVTRNLCYRPQLDKDSIGSSKLNYYAGATVRQPTLFGGHWVPQYAAYTERRGEYRAYLRTTYVGADVSATRNISARTPFRLGYTLELGRTQAEAAVLCAIFSRCTSTDLTDIQRKMRLAVASASLQQVRTDNPVSPRAGYAWTAELRTAGSWLGTDSAQSFRKITGDFSLYRPVTSRITFATRFRGGYIMGGGGWNDQTLPPPQERLFAGGAASDRGFRENELGPQVYLVDTTQFERQKITDSTYALVAKPGARQSRTIPVGGNALVLLNAELRIRDPFFPELIEYVPFVDAGQLWTRQNGTRQINQNRLIVTPGIGARYFSPVGPIQLNVGYNPTAGRAGPAYWAAPVDDSTAVNGPLLCVTPTGATQVPILTDSKGHLVRTLGDVCPADFVPFRSSNFFNRLVLTVSIGASF